MNFKLLRHSLCFLFIICNTLLQAQPLLHHIEKLTTDNGLNSNTITDIVQDRQGYLWIATWHGLNRYDGTEVVPYFAGKRAGSLPDNIIYRLLPSDSVHILVATHRGLSVLDTRTDSFRNIIFPSGSMAGFPGEKQELKDNRVLLLEKDFNGNFWIGTSSCIYRLDKSLQLQKTFYSGYKVRDIEGTRVQYVYKIMPLLTGEVLCWLASGVYIWNRGTDTLTELRTLRNSRWSFLQGSLPNQCFSIYDRYLAFINYGKNTFSVIDEQSGDSASCPLPGNNKNKASFIQSVSGLEDGWIAFSFSVNGVTWVKLQRKGETLSLMPDEGSYLADYAFGKWITDREDNLWITTSMNGLLKVSPGKQVFRTKELKERQSSKAPACEIISFYKWRKRLFAGTAGNGFYEWNLVNGNLNHHSVQYSSHSENTVWNFHSHSGDILWLGTQQGLLRYNLKTKQLGRLNQPHPPILDSFAITTQFTDSQGWVWMGVGYGKGVSVYNPLKKTFKVFPHKENAYPYRYPMAIEEDKYHNLWFISDATPHLVKWIRKENRFRKILIPRFEGISYVQSGGFYLNPQKGIIWYGVQSAGLVRYDMENGSVKVYGMVDGLSTDLIYSIREDREGILWLSTAQGLSSFDPEKEHFINYQHADGLSSSYFSAKMYYDTLTNRMYAGAPGRITWFATSAFRKEEKPFPVRLTGLSVNNTPLQIPGNYTLSLPSRSNDITLSFTGINLTNGRENKYAYRMGNDHAEWINIGSQRQIRFASLNPGHYAFEVKALRKDGSWSLQTDRLELNIRKPFARTIWFYLVCFVFTGSAIYGWYRHRFKQLMQLEQMRSRISHDLHDEIGSRLTNIGMMSQIVRQRQLSQDDNHSWLQRIQEESEAVSQSMREIIWNIHPDNDSMEEAMPRMLHFATGLLEAKGIIVQAFIPELAGIKIDMEKRRDLFAIFKEAVHNIARHSGAKQSVIRVCLDRKIFRLEITDDGKGFNKEGLSFYNGLKYMHQRANKNRWDLNIVSDQEKGTHLTLNIKIT